MRDMEFLQSTLAGIIGAVSISLAVLSYLHAKFVTRSEFEAQSEATRDQHKSMLQTLTKIDDKIESINDKLFDLKADD